jgi:hypothetical protein
VLDALGREIAAPILQRAVNDTAPAVARAARLRFDTEAE